MVKVWLVVAILSVGFAAWIIYQKGFKEGAWALMLPVIAGVWYTIRRFMLRRLEAMVEAEEARKSES